MKRRRWLMASAALLCGCASGVPRQEAPAGPIAEPAGYDIILRNGTIYDGSGEAPFTGDVGVRGDRIVAVGELGPAAGKTEIDAKGLAISPGFIDTVSFSYEVFPADSRALSKIYQGVTLEVFGEGDSPGPLTSAMKAEIKSRQYQFKFELPWTTFGGYLDYQASKGAGVNFGSYVGATTVRRHVIGDSSRAPTPEELAQMQALVRQAMREGALGLTACLSAPPASYAQREELTALARAAAELDGIYEVGLRHESNGVLEALDEALDVARGAGARAEVVLFKQSGERNWPKLDAMIAKIEAARAGGTGVTATMYTYTALSTALSSAIPSWAHDGGFGALLARLRDPEQRGRIIREMRGWKDGWEQLIALSGTPENVILLKLDDPMRQYQGKTLADVMRARGVSAEEAAVDLLRDTGNEVWGAFKTMSEDNLRREIALPWMGFASGDTASAAEGTFLQSLVHPRAYGNVPRLLGKYVRDDGVISLQEAVRRLTSLPASNLRIRDRGALKPGFFADIVVFDPATVRDNATFPAPHAYATGVRHVLVNGVAVLEDGRHTGALPGRPVRGPGWTN
ncbi:N-acyl-D-amino-acid deacylase family protein [Sorangium sp. So ce1151]|uniref:N-acyl-D-amino-acid deacylase family protein n=1 Tax=Sorangium sp. So ce1151 TaxID=3133332 RepID=UPI003F5EFAB6